MAKKQPWRQYVEGLTPAKQKKMLLVLLEWQIDEIGEDIHYLEAEDGEPEAIIWAACGDSILDGR